jgi:hypothetical protein
MTFGKVILDEMIHSTAKPKLKLLGLSFKRISYIFNISKRFLFLLALYFRLQTSLKIILTLKKKELKKFKLQNNNEFRIKQH